MMQIKNFSPIKIILLLAALLPPVSVFASADLGEIEVTSPQDNTRYDETASSNVIIPSNEPNRSVTELIEENPGIHVKRYGSMDDSGTISFRGAPANQVQTFYDNVPLGGSSGNVVDLSIAPPENIERMEIYRGGAPAKAPDPSPAGAIFLSTPEKPKEFGIKFLNSFGSFTTYKGNLQIKQPFKKSWYFVSFEEMGSKGNFLYKNDNGTRSNPSDDTLIKRENNDFLSENLLTKYGWNGDNLKLTVSNTLLIKRQGIPGQVNAPTNNARLNTNRNITILNGEHQIANGTFFFDYQNSRFLDPNGDVGLGVQDNNDSTYRFGEEFFRYFEPNGNNKIFVSVAHRGEFYKPKNYAAANPNGTTSIRNELGITAENTITVANERITLTPSARFNFTFNSLSGNDPSYPSLSSSYQNSENYYQLTAKLGVKTRIWNELYFKANVYRGFRNPNFNELFGDRGMLVGNPTLSPEKAINLDAGLVFEEAGVGILDKMKFAATYFRNDEKDLIQFVQISQTSAKAMNLSSATIQGVESSAEIYYLGHISHTISYTFQNPKDTSNTGTNGKYLPGRPRNELWFTTNLFNDWGKLYAEYNFISGNFLDTQNLIEVKRRNLIALGAALFPKKWFIVNFDVKNISNDRTVDMIGFPLPGRSYWGAITFKI